MLCWKPGQRCILRTEIFSNTHRAVISRQCGIEGFFCWCNKSFYSYIKKKLYPYAAIFFKCGHQVTTFLLFNLVFSGTRWTLVASSRGSQPHTVSDGLNPTGIRIHAWVYYCTAQCWTVAR